MKIDFHTHGKLAKKLPFSKVYTNWLFGEAKKAGLDALCLTEHLNTLQFDELYGYLSTRSTREGDALAAREVDEMADTLGLALSIIAETTDPEIFLVGGGVARAGDVLFNPLIAHYKEYAFRSCRETPIKQASLGNDAGIYGAVRLIVGAEV